jgi:hypothetical protein
MLQELSCFKCLLNTNGCKGRIVLDWIFNFFIGNLGSFSMSNYIHLFYSFALSLGVCNRHVLFLFDSIQDSRFFLLYLKCLYFRVLRFFFDYSFSLFWDNFLFPYSLNLFITILLFVLLLFMSRLVINLRLLFNWRCKLVFF